jgi:fatty-acyl-CoA synthase
VPSGPSPSRVNFRLAPAEAAYILQDSGASLVVTDPLLAPLATAAVGETAQTPVLTTGVDGSYEALLAGAQPGEGEDEAAIDERDVALIMYTSGTTGRPRAPCSPT